MLEIKTGENYTVNRARSGTNDRGIWELIVVKSEDRSKKEITIWPTNKPTGAYDDGIITIKKIESVKYAARKGLKGEWRDDVSIVAEVEVHNPNELYSNMDANGYGFEDNPFTSASDTPFAEDNPFGDDDVLPL